MIIHKRLPVTLLELLVVMAILAAVSGLVTLSINKALVDQRFRTEVSLILDDLRRAQDIMMILGADVHVKFADSKKEKGINYWLEMETQLSPGLQKEIVKNVRLLKTIRGVFFRDKTQNIEGSIDLSFVSKGAIMSKGVLHLSITENENPDQKTLQTFICLAGYPRPIVEMDTKEEAEKICEAPQDEAFNNSLTRDTLERLPEKVKQPVPANPSNSPEPSPSGGKKNNKALNPDEARKQA